MDTQDVNGKQTAVTEISEMKKQASDFLRSRFFYAASDIYAQILEENPNDKDAHLGLLMCSVKKSSESDLVEYYQNLFSDDRYEIRLACDRDEGYVVEMCDRYCVPDYLEKSDIRKMYDFDVSFRSCLFSRKKQRDEILKLIEKDEHLSWLKDKGFKEISDIIKAYDRRIDDAEEADKENIERIKNDYQRFLYQTFSEVKEKNREARESKDHDYRELAGRFEACFDIDGLRELSLQFEKFKGYKEADRFIELCDRKIEDLKAKAQKESERKVAESVLDEAKADLVTGKFSSAYDGFTRVVSMQGDNEDAYLGILMARTKTTDLNELADYCRNLYSEDRWEILEACEEDAEHINEMVEKYCLPEFLDKETIREKYSYDRTYRSRLASKIEEEKRFRNDTESDPVFEWVRRNGSDRIKKQFRDVCDSYSRRVKEAQEEDKRNIERIRNDYQRFLFKTYSSIKKLHKDACDRKEEAYRDILVSYELANSEAEFNNIILKLKDLGDYKEAGRYIVLCHKKISDLKEREKNENDAQEIETSLIAAKAYLSAGNIDLADQSLSKVLSMDSDNPRAYLGILMIETGTKNVNELIRYYIDLYSEDETNRLEACEEDRNHIENVAEEYQVPGYLEKETIKKYYSFDREFESLTASRIRQKEQFEEEVKMNPLLVKISAGKESDREIASFFERIYEGYDARIAESQKADEKQVNSIKHIYEIYLQESDKTVYKIYEEKLKEKNDESEALYLRNIEQYEKDLNEDELEELSKSFDVDYKDGQSYVYRCLDRIKQLRISREKEKLDTLLREGTELLESGMYLSAKDKYASYIEIDPDNETAHLGLLMAEKEVSDIDQLFEYYKNLYSDEILETKTAVEEDIRHIEEMCDKCCIPELLEKEDIRKRYEFDRTYESLSGCRHIQKKQIEDEIGLDPSLFWLNKNGSAEIRSSINDLLDVYQKRVNAAEEEDNYLVQTVTRDYKAFIRNTDREVRSLYNELNKKRNQNLKLAEKRKREEELKRKEEEEKERKLREEALRKEKELREEAQRTEREAKEKARQEQRRKEEKARIEKEASAKIEKEKKKEEKQRKFLEAKQQKEAEKKERRPLHLNFGLISAALSLILLAVVVYIYVLVPSNKYKNATELAERGEYDEAIAIFEELGDYKDSKYKTKETIYQKADDLYQHQKLVEAANIFGNLRFDDSEDRVREIKDAMISKAQIGDTILFGDYEQDGNTENGKEMIEWIVLDKQEGSILVVSKYAIEASRFNSGSEEIYWENCSLRSWLNGRFPDNAFTKEKPSAVLQTPLNNFRYPETEEGETVDADEVIPIEYETRDKIFLLSVEEVEQYYPEESARICKATEYAIENGVAANADDDCSWWLRDPGEPYEKMSSYVSGSTGIISSSMYEIVLGIRPAMWLKIAD